MLALKNLKVDDAYTSVTASEQMLVSIIYMN